MRPPCEASVSECECASAERTRQSQRVAADLDRCGRYTLKSAGAAPNCALDSGRRVQCVACAPAFDCSRPARDCSARDVNKIRAKALFTGSYSKSEYTETRSKLVCAFLPNVASFAMSEILGELRPRGTAA